MSDELTPDLEAIRDDFLRSFLDETWEDKQEAQTDARLDWLLEKITEHKEAMRQNDVIAEGRRVQIEDWRQGENAKHERAISWLEYQIREIVPPDVESFERAYKQKSRSLPFGVVGFRKSPSKIEVFDEERTLAWAKLHKLPIKIKESYSKADLKKAIQTTTDPPDGFQVVPGMSEFFVRTDDLSPKKGH